MLCRTLEGIAHAAPYGRAGKQAQRIKTRPRPAVEPMTIPSTSSRKLSVGCGHDTRSGWVNLDIAPLPGVDVVHDLDEIPLPLSDGAFDYVECIDILEHVKDLPAVMRELHRVLAPGGRFRIEGPHFTSYTWPTDPTHRRSFAINTFEFFARGSFLERDYYFDFAFAEVEYRSIRFQRVIYQPWNWVLEPLINAHRRLQSYYEATVLARLFPAHRIEVVLVR
jgi:SAM-dependent methyltransferase